MSRFTRSRWSLLAAATGLALVLSGCGEHPMDSLTPAGPNAQKIDDLLMIVLGNGMTRDVYRRGPGDGFAHAAALASRQASDPVANRGATGA